MTRKEAMQAMVPVAGKHKKKEKKDKKSAEAKKEAQAKCKMLKGKLMKGLKAKMKELKVLEAMAEKKTPEKNNQQNLKTKPSAIKKANLKTKLSVLKKAVKKDVLKDEVKSKKKDMQKNMEKYEGSKWKQLKKQLLKDRPVKNIAAALAELSKQLEEANGAEEGAKGEKKKQTAVEECAFAEIQLEGTKVIVDSESAGKKHFGAQAVVKKRRRR